MMTSHPTIRLKIMYVRCECVGVCLCMCGLPSMCSFSPPMHKMEKHQRAEEPVQAKRPWKRQTAHIPQRYRERAMEVFEEDAEYDAFFNARALQETPHQESQQVLLKDIEVVSLFCISLLFMPSFKCGGCNRKTAIQCAGNQLLMTLHSSSYATPLPKVMTKQRLLRLCSRAASGS